MCVRVCVALGLYVFVLHVYACAWSQVYDIIVRLCNFYLYTHYGGACSNMRKQSICKCKPAAQGNLHV